MENPHHAVQPDFAVEEHAAARLIFTDDGKTNQKAIGKLTALWTVNNMRERAICDLRVEEEHCTACEAREQAVEEDQLRKDTLADEQEHRCSQLS
jgi:hypothetical protein